MKGLPGFLTLSALVGLAGAALAAPLPDTEAAAMKTQPVNPDWTAPYKPLNRHDLNGLWLDNGTGGFDTVHRPGPDEKPPYTPAFQKIWVKLLDDIEKGRPSNNPPADCLPQGMPRLMHASYPMEIVQNGVVLNIFSEWNEQTRRIYLDGRPFDLENGPSYYGQSVGHWEGDALITTTLGIRGDTNLDGTGMPHSDAMWVSEKMWLQDDNTLKDEITLVDKKAFVAPWTVTRTYRRAPGNYRILPYVCLENNRNPKDATGATTAVLQGGKSPGGR